MGHRFFRLKLRGEESEVHPFGERIWLNGSTVTVHTARQSASCDHCHRFIDRRDIYVRFRVLRGDSVPMGTDRRCTACVKRGVLPHDIEMIEIVEE